MKPLRSIYFMLIALLAVSCYENEISEKTIPVDVHRLSEDVSFYDIFKHISVTPLETNDNNLISEVSRKMYADSTFYVFDRRQSGVFAFNYRGEYLYKIHQIGRGPGEYLRIVDFDINHFTNSVDVLTPVGEVLKYDSKDGEFIDSYHLPDNIRAVHYLKYLSEDSVVFYQMFEENVLVFYCLKNQSILNEIHELPSFVHRYLPGSNQISPFQIVDEKLILFEHFSNTVHVLGKEKLIPRYTWDFGKYNLKIEDIEPGRDRQFYYDYIDNSTLVYLFVSYIENEDLVITDFLFDKSYYTLIYFKENNEYVIIDKFKEGVSYPHYPSPLDDGVFIVVPPHYVSFYINKEMAKKYNVDVSNIKENGNPIIIKYAFK